MLTRRAALGTLATGLAFGGLSGCVEIRKWLQPDLADGSIDIHTHFFNGRDVPAVGFLQQTFLREPHQPVDPDMLGEAFIKLLKTILLTNTPTAKAELAAIGTEGANSASSPEALERQDQQNVADALVAFAEGAAPDSAGFSVTRSDEATLLDRIAQDVEQVALRRSLQTPAQQARVLSNEIYAKAGLSELRQGTKREYLHLTPLLQSIRWAGLLTRSRRDILAELNRLYGGENQIRVFSPSIVDFTWWFKADEPDVEPVADQIEVVSAISATHQNALILPFCPFDPLRAALEREDQPELDPLRNVKNAILNRGFAGVKLYPPMGFKPWGNAGIVTDWAKRSPKDGGAALDRELGGLYSWCIDNDVPIKAHANNSIAAGPNTGTFASPREWRRVLEQTEFRGLRLNLAHFGGFDETRPRSLNGGPQDWEVLISELIDEFEGLYFDLGFWSVAIDQHEAYRQHMMTRMRMLLADVPQMKERMMYGSDWSMIGRVTGHQTYSADVIAALDELGFTDTELEDVMAGNAARYLGMQPGSTQRDRLTNFFSGHPIFEEVFGT